MNETIKIATDLGRLAARQEFVDELVNLQKQGYVFKAANTKQPARPNKPANNKKR